MALVKDSYSKKIVGYDVSNSLLARGTVRALDMAIANRLYPKKALIHHSYRVFHIAVTYIKKYSEKAASSAA